VLVDGNDIRFKHRRIHCTPTGWSSSRNLCSGFRDGNIRYAKPDATDADG